MTPRPPRARIAAEERGFSLIEVMVAVIILGIGLMGMAAVFPYGSKATVSDRLISSAVDLATQKMEELRTKRYSDAFLTAGWHPSSSGEQVGSNSRFTRRYLVTDLTGAMAGVKHVEVQVTWASTNPDTIRIVTYFRR